MWLARQSPTYEVRSIARLGTGLDNVAYEVNGELVIRQSAETDLALRSELTRREADLLAAVAEISPVPVPDVIIADLESGILAYRKLPGVPLLGRAVAEPERLAATLGEVLSRLYEAPVETMKTLVPYETEPLATWLDAARDAYSEIAELLPRGARPRVEGFLGHPPPPEPRLLAFCHNDLGGEHALVDIETAAVTGIIDWTDAAIADPAHDLGLLFRDLGPGVLDLVLTHHVGRLDDAHRDRAVFYARCALLEDVAYGERTGARRYGEAGLEHLARTFA